MDDSSSPSDTIEHHSYMALVDFVQLFQHGEKKHLDLSEATMEVEALDALIDMLKRTQIVTKLDLRRACHLGDDAGFPSFITQALLVNTSVTRLNFSMSALGRSGAQLMSELLMGNKTLASLWISDNGIGNEGAKHIADALKVNDTLTELNISFNALGHEGIGFIFEALKTNKSLSRLYIGRHAHAFSEPCVKTLTEMLSVNTSLKELWLSNSYLQPACLRAIYDCLKVNRTLEVLGANCSTFDTDAIDAFAEALRLNQSLQHVDISCCAIGPNSLQKVLRSLRGNTTLRCFNMFGVDVDDACAHVLAECIRDNVALSTLYVTRRMPSLEDALLSNGNITQCPGQTDIVTEICIRNKRMHASAKKSAELLCAIRKYRISPLNDTPKEIVCMIAQHLWNTKSEISAWTKL